MSIKENSNINSGGAIDASQVSQLAQTALTATGIEIPKEVQQLEQAANVAKQASSLLSNPSLPNMGLQSIGSLPKSVTDIQNGLKSALEKSHIVYTEIAIGGDKVLTESTYSVDIRQKVGEHDQFDIVCPTEGLEDFGAYPLKNTKTYLGKIITIQLKQFGKTEYLFKGIIRSVKTRKYDGCEGDIIISGCSPTILLENGFDCQSYENKTLQQIIEEATAEYTKESVSFKLNPEMVKPLDYTVQYKETDFQFIKRLAVRYGEWFFYDGEKIVFGCKGASGGKVVEVVEEVDMFEYELKLNILPQEFTYLAYDPHHAESHKVSSKDVQSKQSVNPFVNYAVNASKRVYTKVPTSLYNQSLMEKGKQELTEAVKRQKDSRNHVMVIEGKSRKPGIRVGDIVKMKAYMPGNTFLNTAEIPLESYRVIEISHHHDGVDEYYNHFIGIPLDSIVPPYMNEDAIPQCEEQSAVVMDNHDPKGMSRIRVQFPWQTQSKVPMSPWIRVTTPYAGKGKGISRIPVWFHHVRR